MMPETPAQWLYALTQAAALVGCVYGLLFIGLALEWVLQ